MAPFYFGPRYFTEKFNEFFLCRVKGGISLLIVPIPLFGGVKDLYKEDFIEKSSLFIEECHSYDCKIIPQIFSGDGEKVNTLTKEELEQIPENLAQAAVRLKEVGYDGMEIHGAHHSLFMHLLSPLLNKRKDEYGGTFQNMTRIQIQTANKIRKAVGPDFPVLFRFSATEFNQGGADLSITLPYAVALEKAGVDCLDISAGGTGASPQYSDCPDHTNEEGCFSSFSHKIKQEVKIPVIVAGRIASKKTAEMILNEHKADMVGLCRVLIADPRWPDKIMTHNEKSIIPMEQWYDIFKALQK